MIFNFTNYVLVAYSAGIITVCEQELFLSNIRDGFGQAVNKDEINKGKIHMNTTAHWILLK